MNQKKIVKLQLPRSINLMLQNNKSPVESTITSNDGVPTASTYMEHQDFESDNMSLEDCSSSSHSIEDFIEKINALSSDESDVPPCEMDEERDPAQIEEMLNPLWTCNGVSCNLSATSLAKTLVEFQIAHKASDSLMDNLCHIVRTILPSNNNMPRNLAALRDLIYMDNAACSVIRTQFFCSPCQLTCETQRCKQCSSITINEFGYFSIVPQIEKIIINYYSHMINYLAKAASSIDNIYGDCITANAYKSYGQNPDVGGVLYLNLIFSSDGAAITQQQVNNSLWPLQATIAELPPKLRNSLQNAVIFGMWLGQKPDWSTFLPHMVHMLQELNDVHLVRLTTGIEVRFKVRIFATIFDSVARASIWSVTQFNGKFGCTKCMNSGVPGTTAGVGKQQIYMPCDDDSVLKDKAFYDDAYDIRRKLCQIGNMEPYLGVKAKPMLSELGHIVDIDVLDTFHIIYEGIASYISKRIFLFDQPSALKNCPCFAGDKVDSIQTVIDKIQWPHDLQRTIRRLSLIKHYKAAEYKNLFYFVMPVITLDIFDDSDAYHFLLVIIEFVHLLNMRSVSEEILHQADHLLNIWLILVPTFLDSNAFTFNLHSLKHLTEQLRKFGCTWSINASVFESWLGWLKTLRTGSTNTLPVIMRRFLDFKTTVSAKFNLSNFASISPVGTSKFIKIDNACWEEHFPSKFALQFCRVRVNCQIYHSKAWNRGRRNSSCVCYNNKDGEKEFGMIQYYLFNEHSHKMFAVVSCYTIQSCIGRLISSPNNLMLKSLYDMSLYGNFHYAVVVSNISKLIPVHTFLSRCIMMQDYKSNLYVCEADSGFEHN